MEKRRFFTAKTVAGLALLCALAVVLQGTLGSISIGAVSLNFALIPIVLSAVLFGALGGGIVGFACGAVTLFQVIAGGAPFYVLIWEHSPVITTVLCLTKTTVAGIVAGIVFALIKNRRVGVFVASAIVPTVNTALFILGCLAMKNTISLIAEGKNILLFILVSIVTFNFFIELLINVICAPALDEVIRVVGRRRKQ